jgi:hypothetical protein
LEKDLIVDFVGQVTDEDVEVVGSILLGGVVRLISPVDANFLSESDHTLCLSSALRAYVVVDATAVESGHASLCRTRIIVFYKSIVETLRVHGFVWNNLDALDVSSRLKNLTQHIFSYSGVQSSHV